MQAAHAPRGDARTYLIDFVGGGLDGERYVVETGEYWNRLTNDVSL
ncbi:MAG: hypothetical protein OXI11_07290 [Gammaproteobacteria bacterium]|nr:hypothetical protein [Gammaproteobacteria bacterium]